MTVITPDRFVRAMQQTATILNGIVQSVSQEVATTRRDPNPGATGGDGWTVAEVVCHLRDLEAIYYERAVRMLREDRPQFPTLDADKMAYESGYNSQNMRNALRAYHETRHMHVSLVAGLTQQEWNRTGVHYRYGVITLLDHVVNVATHDVNHIEQIVRILGSGSYSART